jgi:hypothetical protein
VVTVVFLQFQEEHFFMQQEVEEGVITLMTLAILSEVALEVLAEAEAEVLMVMEIRELEEQVVSPMVLQPLQVEKLPVDKVDRIQEVAEEVLDTTKEQEVGDQGLSILDILQITPQSMLNMLLQLEAEVVDQVPQAQITVEVEEQEDIVLP